LLWSVGTVQRNRKAARTSSGAVRRGPGSTFCSMWKLNAIISASWSNECAIYPRRYSAGMRWTNQRV
uniref:Uncharacterized protein n=1 Tax=Anopheles albimanus TaxID=7167 RepID=A0A182FXM6_ANOAL